MFGGGIETKTKHTYLLDLANLVGEEVLVNGQVLVVGRNGRKYHLVFVLLGVTVEEHTASLANLNGVRVALVLQQAHGSSPVVSVIQDEPPVYHVGCTDASRAVSPNRPLSESEQDWPVRPTRHSASCDFSGPGLISPLLLNEPQSTAAVVVPTIRADRAFDDGIQMETAPLALMSS